MLRDEGRFGKRKSTLKAWVSVVDDPIRSNNQNIDGMWARILTSYELFKPEGIKYHKSENSGNNGKG